MPEQKTLDLYPNNLLFWTHKDRQYCLRATQDTDADDPRNDDNIGIMFCKHPRHTLGDRLNAKSPEDFWADMISEYVPKKDLEQRLKSEHLPDFTPDPKSSAFDQLLDAVQDDGNYKAAIAACEPYIIILPLWIYDHSGITMSCGDPVYPFTDQWDSSLVGWIVLPKEKALHELATPKLDADGNQVTHTNPNGVEIPDYVVCDETNWRQAAERQLKYEVDIYDKYLTDDVYCYELYSRPIKPSTKPDPKMPDYADDWDYEEAFSGFYGTDIMKNGFIDDMGYGFPDAVQSGNFETGTAKTETVTRLIFQED